MLTILKNAKFDKNVDAGGASSPLMPIQEISEPVLKFTYNQKAKAAQIH